MAHSITAAEFEERRKRAAAGAREAGLDGLLVCSRGGGDSTDMPTSAI